MAPILQTTKLTKQFGGLTAVKDLDLTVEPGEIVGLIGPNGAGKSTVFNLITGIYRPTSGTIAWSGALVRASKGVDTCQLIGLQPYDVTALGLARTFQNIRLFGNMCVLENISVAQHCRSKVGVLGAVFRTAAFWSEERRIRRRSEKLLDFVGLLPKAWETAKSLPYGEQRRLEIARALATEPELLLLDEPAAGMNPHETADLMALIARIRTLGKSVLLIEHDMKLVMGICDRVLVMNFGERIAFGKPADVQKDTKVITAYLGSDEKDEG